MCGPCRAGFVAVGEVCVDIALRDIVEERIAGGNVANFSRLLAEATRLRTQDSNGASYVLIAIEHFEMHVRSYPALRLASYFR